MCIEVKRDIKINEAIIGYKKVKKVAWDDKRFISGVGKYSRSSQTGFGTATGTELYYEIGKTVESDMPRTPGIYIFKNKKAVGHVTANEAIIRVKVLPGSQILNGKKNAFTASKIKVLNVVKLG